MKRTPLFTILAAGAITLMACGGDDSVVRRVSAGAPPPSTRRTGARRVHPRCAPARPILAVLVGPNGNTLYGFTNDTATQSNCDGTCAEAWPPVIVTPDWTVAPGVDSAIFNTITRADGSLRSRRRQMAALLLLRRLHSRRSERPGLR